MPNIFRLRQIVTHLRSGNLAHDTFDFNEYNGGERKPNGCGTNGCAVGEFPAIWPDLWEWKPSRALYELVYLPTGKQVSYFDAPIDFLSIKNQTRQFLFTPADAYNPNGLPPTATAQEVADHIETWCNENEKA